MARLTVSERIAETLALHNGLASHRRDVAREKAEISHAVACEDFESGRMLDRAINAYSVKEAIADRAEARGRLATGVKVPPAKTDGPGPTSKDVGTDAATV